MNKTHDTKCSEMKAKKRREEERESIQAHRDIFFGDDADEVI